MNQSGPNIGHHTSKDNFVPYANFSLFMEQMAQSTKQWIFFLKKKKKSAHCFEFCSRAATDFD